MKLLNSIEWNSGSLERVISFKILLCGLGSCLEPVSDWFEFLICRDAQEISFGQKVGAEGLLSASVCEIKEFLAASMKRQWQFQ